MDKIPSVPFALISGSAAWGITFPEDLAEPGVRVVQKNMSFDTPWGPTELWKLLEVDGSLTPDGQPRRILNVFSHGWPVDSIDHSASRRVAWALQQAGVRKILSSSTAGSLNRAIMARDFVIAADILELTQTAYSLLPGRFEYSCSARQMICPHLAGVLEETARAAWPAGSRVYGQANGLVAAHAWGPRFQTAAEVIAYRSMGADFTNHSIAPEATLAREIGACFVNCTYITAAFADYFAPPRGTLLTGNVHQEMVPVASRIALKAIARAELTDSCGCAGQRTVWPVDFRPKD
jgi:5'-methylthioadenosine phosphorylase